MGGGGGGNIEWRAYWLEARGVVRADGAGDCVEEGSVGDAYAKSCLWRGGGVSCEGGGEGHGSGDESWADVEGEALLGWNPHAVDAEEGFDAFEQLRVVKRLGGGGGKAGATQGGGSLGARDERRRREGAACFGRGGRGGCCPLRPCTPSCPRSTGQ
jgi:hypothetical protein